MEQRARIDRGFLARSAIPVEMRFLNRPVADALELSRTFTLSARGQVFGYMVLDPYFRAGRVAGALLNLVRFEPTRVWGLYYAVVAMLQGQLERDGVPELSLGFSPLAHLDTTGCSPRLSPQVTWMARKLSGVEYVARLRELKDAFPGTLAQRYFVTPSRLVPTVLVRLIKACGVPFGSIVRRSLAPNADGLRGIRSVPPERR